MIKDKEKENPYIEVRWYLSDILDYAENEGIELKREEGLKVLALLEKNHDCTIGISWDEIGYSIEKVIDEPKEEKETV